MYIYIYIYIYIYNIYIYNYRNCFTTNICLARKWWVSQRSHKTYWKEAGGPGRESGNPGVSGGPGWQSWDILAARLSKSRQVQASGPRRLPQVLKAPGKAPEVWCTHRSTWLCYASQALQIGCTYRKSSSNIQAPSLNALKDTICFKGHNVVMTVTHFGSIWGAPGDHKSRRRRWQDAGRSHRRRWQGLRRFSDRRRGPQERLREVESTMGERILPKALVLTPWIYIYIYIWDCLFYCDFCRTPEGKLGHSGEGTNENSWRTKLISRPWVWRRKSIWTLV